MRIDKSIEEELSFWEQQLKNAPAPLNLPKRRKRPALYTSRITKEPFVIPSEQVKQLLQLSKREKASLFILLLAAFHALVSRYTAQTDIVTNIVVGQEGGGLHSPSRGYHNILPLRITTSENPSFRALFKQVQKGVAETHAHRNVPFNRLLEMQETESCVNQGALPQVLFLFHENDDNTADEQEIPDKYVMREDGSSVFDLILQLKISKGEICGSAIYKSEMFEANVIQEFIVCYQVLLAGIFAHPEQCISDFPLLSAAARRQLLFTWNLTQKDFSQNLCFHHFFEKQVISRPDAIAVAHTENALSYQELNRRANQLACYLQALGVGPEVLVGVFIEPSFDLMVSLLGILKAGGAYVPLDPMYPLDRLAFMLQDAHVQILLTHEHLANTLPVSTPNICLDKEWAKIAQKSDGIECPKDAVTGKNLAYVIYTSGSTGQPKGVQVTHQGLSNYAIAISKAFGHQPIDRMLQLASVSFDVAVEEIFPLWLSGATVVLCDRQQLASPRELLRTIEQEQLTVFVLLTAYWHEWVRELTRSFECIPGCVSRVIMGGERVLPELLADWQKFGIPLINVYGLTEVTVTSAVHKVVAEDEDREVSIGRPIANTYFYVLDRFMQPVPIGAAGELYIGGEGLARGYLNQPDLTATRFVPHPFSEELGARLYRTGDLVRYRQDGDVEFLGRIDTQVKVRGFRIELEEIEVVLCQHFRVQQCMVVVREDEPGDKRLVAYVVASNQKQAPRVGELRRFLQQSLPDYMIPAIFVLLERLPLTANAKVDHQALPRPSAGNVLEYEGNFVAPRTPIEEILAFVYADVLGLEKVGMHENFFELGGQSLLAASMVSQIRDMFGIELSLRTFFEQSTIEQLAEHLVSIGQDIAKIAQILLQLNKLSDDEIKLALVEKGCP